MLDGYTLNPGDVSWDPLISLGEITFYPATREDEIVQRSAEAELIMTDSVRITADTMKRLPKLQHIAVMATGFDHIDLDAAGNQGVTVSNIPSYGTGSVAQMTISHILNLSHHIYEHNESVRNGDWSRSPYYCYWNYPQISLEGKVLGLIGFGRIAQKTADIAAALDMEVIAYAPRTSDQSQRKNFRWVSLETLLSTADFISLHAPLTPETEGMIDRRALSLVKPTAFLINTGRGKLINEEDLAEALQSGKLAGAGLDVLSSEPPEEGNSLLKAPNCFITPHIAWATVTARSRLISILAETIEAWMKGKPIHLVR